MSTSRDDGWSSGWAFFGWACGLWGTQLPEVSEGEVMKSRPRRPRRSRKRRPRASDNTTALPQRRSTC